MAWVASRRDLTSRVWLNPIFTVALEVTTSVLSLSGTGLRNWAHAVFQEQMGSRISIASYLRKRISIPRERILIPLTLSASQEQFSCSLRNSSQSLRNRFLANCMVSQDSSFSHRDRFLIRSMDNCVMYNHAWMLYIIHGITIASQDRANNNSYENVTSSVSYS